MNLALLVGGLLLLGACGSVNHTANQTKNKTVEKQEIGDRIDSSKEEPDDPNATREQKSALISARNYLDGNTGFSAKGLAEQLTYEKFPQGAVDYAMKHIKVDWKEQALIKAQSYIDEEVGFSSKGLTEQLQFEKFASEEIDYAMKNIKVDWNKQAIIKAKSYADSEIGMSDQGIYDQLIFEGFTEDQARVGLSKLAK